MAASVSTWKDSAACISGDPDDWMLADGHSGKLLSAGNIRAKRTCRTSCPVREACLEDALRMRDCGVIRGGAVLAEPMRWATCRCGEQYLRPIRKSVPTCSAKCTRALRAEERARQPQTLAA